MRAAVGALALGAALAGCGRVYVRPSRMDASVSNRDASGDRTSETGPNYPYPACEDHTSLPSTAIDLLVVMQNSPSTQGRQLLLAKALSSFTRGLLSDLTRSGANPSLRVGVVSSDLGVASYPGTPALPGCIPHGTNGLRGDHGMLSPLGAGAAETTHLPWNLPLDPQGDTLTSLLERDLGITCSREPTLSAYPRYLTYCDDRSLGCILDQSAFGLRVACSAALGAGGCAVPSPLEAALLALGENTRPGFPNEGFLREEALLVILVLTDRDDASVRLDAEQVFDPSDMRWAQTSDLLGRLYLFPDPGGMQDPLYNLDRYVSVGTPNTGFLALKPGHPERVFFAAITGIPIFLPEVRVGNSFRTDWDTLLGPPGPNGTEDWASRQSQRAYRGVQVVDGQSVNVTMRQPAATEFCTPETQQPACADAPFVESCTENRAFPARRLAEVARRFDVAPLCNGCACRNGLVLSTCHGQDTSSLYNAFSAVRDRVLRRALLQ